MKEQTLLNQASPKIFLLVMLLMSANSVVLAQTTTFTYQGRLTDGGTPANGTYDLQFALFDSISSGGQIGSSQTVPSVSVGSGIFTVSLDFGAGAFSGANRFLEISARLSGGGSFTLLAPRQQITATPYAVRSLLTNAADALTGACVGCVQDANINGVAGSKVNGTIPVAGVPAGSSSYIQNTSSPQASSNFNISGNGTAGILNAATQYNLGGSRVLSMAGTFNTFVGIGTGLNNTGSSNAFFGSNAGLANSSGSANSFFGSSAGNNNTTGTGNSFFGNRAGQSTSAGDSNSFFGDQAGFNNTADDNSFFGRLAGNLNSTGSHNSFFGSNAGLANTTAGDNSFFGDSAGRVNTTGSQNSFFGENAGAGNAADGNSFFGSSAGKANTTGTRNAFFGRLAGTGNTTGDDNSFFGSAAGQLNTAGTGNSFFGQEAGSKSNGFANAFFGSIAGLSNTTGSGNAFFGEGGGYNNTTGETNTFVGANAGFRNTTGSYNTVVGGFATVGSANLDHATAIGSEAVVNTSNTIVLGRADGSDFVRIPGLLTIPNLAAAGNTQLCRNAFDRVSDCSSSLRYKTNLAAYHSGLSVINRLRPISFTWKEGGMRDVGFGAEDVEQIDPLLVTYNKQGQVEGVKYDRINVVLVNAIREQQQQIDAQRKQIGELQVELKRRRQVDEQLQQQQAQIDSLKKLICGMNPKPAPCPR